MKRLTKQQIELIKELKAKGLIVKEIASKVKCSIDAVTYHTNDNYRNYKKGEYARSKYRHLTKQEKKIRYNKSKEYFKEYFKNRYHNDLEFRNKHLERVKRNQK